MIYLKRLWRGWFFFNFCLTMIILYPAFAILLSRKEWYIHVHKLKKIWAKMLTFNCGIRLNVKFEEPLDRTKTYVICPNHTSYLDVILTYLAVPNYFHYVAKIELAQIPLFGIFFKKMDIAFDRSSIKAAQKAFHLAARDLQQGTSIAMFPEGTISAEAPKLVRFKNGPFKLAIENQIAILPVTFLNNWLILPDGRRASEGGTPGVAKVMIHKAIETQGMSIQELEQLKQQVFDTIQFTLSDYANRP